MEAGELEPAGVSRRVLDGLARDPRRRGPASSQARGRPQRPGARLPRRPHGSGPHRGAADAVREDLEVLADALAAAPAGDDWDEVDVLFRGGR